MYKLQITKTETNPNYEQELKDYREKERYNNYHSDIIPVQREIIKDVLIVELTDEQYKKVKAEVFKAFE